MRWYAYGLAALPLSEEAGCNGCATERRGGAEANSANDLADEPHLSAGC